MIIQKRYRVDPPPGGGRPRTERTGETERGEARTPERRETTSPRPRHPDPSGAVGRAGAGLADLTGAGGRVSRAAGVAAVGTMDWAREQRDRFGALLSEAHTLVEHARTTERRNSDDPSILTDLRRAAGLIAEARGILGTVRGAFPDRGGIWEGEGTAHQTEIWNFSTNVEMLNQSGSELYRVATLYDAGRPSTEHIARNLESIYTASGAASVSMPAGPRTP